MMRIIVAFVVGTVLRACCLWVGMKLATVDGKFLAILIIAAVTSLLNLIPGVGWLIGIIVMFVLIDKLTDASFLDAFWMVVFANVVAICAVVFLLSLKFSSF